MYAVPDKINQADYALDAAVTLLEFYEDYFSIPYPLPKQGRAFAQRLQILVFNELSHWLYHPNWHPYSYLSSNLSLKFWQVSTIGSILLTLDLYNKLMIVKADFDAVPEAQGMEIICLWTLKRNSTILQFFYYQLMLGGNINFFEWTNLHRIRKSAFLSYKNPLKLFCLSFLSEWGSWAFKVGWVLKAFKIIQSCQSLK